MLSTGMECRSIDAPPAIDARPAASTDPDGLPVFLDRAGGTYTAGNEDPGANTSSILNHPVTLLPYGQDDATWQGIVTCVADLVAPFHLRVTTEDPGEVDQIEIAITGSRSADAFGVNQAPAISPSACAPLRRMVNFVMPNELAAQDPRVICQFAAQAIGHAAGIQWTPDCSDVMAFDIANPACTGADGFRDASIACGTTAPSTCFCDPTATTQNTFAMMTSAFGACP